MLIRLEYNGRIVQEISSSALSGEIVIGRSHACTWPVPKEDTVASSRHAAVFLKGKAVWIKDLKSTNGTFHNSKKITKKKLAVGDKIGIGNCFLCAEPDRGGSDKKAASEVVVLSGKGRGQKKTLAPPVFTIGSDPTSNLVFLDMLVSRHHAEILVKEDSSCWVRDLGSKNGTSVNGMPLRDNKERLLKDGDRISVSHFEVEFHDGSVSHSNKQTWLRLAILVLTLVSGLTAYAAYQRVRPSAESFIQEARRLAAKEAFSEASAAVEKAATARHAASSQVTIEELRRLLSAWQTTVTVWARARQSLEKGKWTQVSRDLGLLQASKRDAWEWNAQASVENGNMSRAKKMLDAYLHAEAAVGREELTCDELAEDHAAVTNALATLNESVPPYLAPLKAELEKIEARQATLLGENGTFEQVLDGLKREPTPYGEILKAVEQAAASQEPALKRRAQALEPAIRALAESAGLLDGAEQLIRELELMQALAVDIKMPSVDECSLDPRVSLARQTLEKNRSSLRVKAGQTVALFTEVEKRIGREGDTPECLRPFADADLLTRALACDVLEQPLPKRSRKEPVGEFDRLFGAEEFYIHLSAYPGQADPAMMSDLPFVSALTQFREAVQKSEIFLSFMRQPENKALHGGKIQAQLTRLEGILARRDALVAVMVTKAEADSGRAGLIAGGIVARLATTDKVQIQNARPQEWVAAGLKRLRATLLRLNDEYSLAAPARQIEIRNEIMKNGLPGDPLVRRMWAFRDSVTK